MSILIKAGKSYYEIPDDVLKEHKITKAKFEKGRKKAGDVEGQGWDCNLVDLTTCCMSKKSLWASC